MIDSGYFYNAIKRDIAMVRGDTMSFAFQLKGLEGQRPEDVVFCCKENLEDTDCLFKVSLSDTIDLRDYDSESDTLTYTVRIPPYKTSNIPLGRFFYDLGVMVNGDVITLMIGRISVEYEVYRDGTPEPVPVPSGDAIEYPVENIPAGEQKAYTEQFVSNIAVAINGITGESGSYTVEEMSGAITTEIGGIISDLEARIPEEIDEVSFPVTD